MRYGSYPGIVSLKAVYESTREVFLVLQLLKGGDLLDYMMVKVSKELSAFLHTHLIVFVIYRRVV